MSFLKSDQVRRGLGAAASAYRFVTLMAIAVMATAGLAGLIYAVVTGSDPANPRF